LYSLPIQDVSKVQIVPSWMCNPCKGTWCECCCYRTL